MSGNIERRGMLRRCLETCENHGGDRIGNVTNKDETKVWTESPGCRDHMEMDGMNGARGDD